MAEFSGNIDDAIASLQKADIFTDETAKTMLVAGGGIMLKNIQSAFVFHRTGQTKAHIQLGSRIRKDKNGCPYITITVPGADARGQRYGLKAAVLNFGRKKGGQIPASHYWTNAVKRSWDAVNDKMARIADEKLKEV